MRVRVCPQLLVPLPVEPVIEPDVSKITMKYGVTADWASARDNGQSATHETQMKNVRRERSIKKLSTERMAERAPDCLRTIVRYSELCRKNSLSFGGWTDPGAIEGALLGQCGIFLHAGPRSRLVIRNGIPAAPRRIAEEGIRHGTARKQC